jgi:hypothetical protein
MDTHSSEPARPSRRWLPLLLIFATILATGLLCGDALARLNPAPRDADSVIQPDIALEIDRGPLPAAPSNDLVQVDDLADRPAGTAEVDASSAPAVLVESQFPQPSVAVAPDAELQAGSNGNTNPNANPNGHSNSANNGNGQNGNGQNGNGQNGNGQNGNGQNGKP